MSDGPGLPEFRARLIGGIFRSVSEARSPDHRDQDERALRKWPGNEFRALSRVRDRKWSGGSVPRVVTGRMVATLTASPGLLDTVVLAPDRVFDHVLESCGSGASGRVDAWIAMCWTSEAAWSVVSCGESLAPEEATRLRPLAARLRFLVLSEPMRWRAQPGTWWDYKPDRQMGGSGIFGQVLGEPSSWERLVEACGQARAAWLECLDCYQDHLLLRQAEPAGLEEELRLILFKSGDGRAGPLALSSAPLVQPASPTLADRDVIAGSVDRHLLPRFAIGAVIRLALHDDSAPRRAARTGLAAAAAGAGLAAVALAGSLQVRLAVYLAVACYGLICAGICVFPAGWGAMWLLRMPAASAVGVVTLVTFLPGGWVAPPPNGWSGAGGWHAAAVLVAAAFGYLLVEARNHGIASGAALTRALAVTVIGLAHALMISVLGLAVIAPAFTQSGWALRELWAQPQYGHAGMVLALATAWCLAFGVFSQVLWDDRPITATLAHLSWRRGR